MTWDTSPFPPYTAAVPTAVADKTPSSAAATSAENRVKGFDVFAVPRVGVDVPFSPDCTGDFPLHLRQIASAKVLDSESGLYYLRARYYDPATAQFMSRDPAVATTMAPYSYAAGDPLDATDPSGMLACDTTATLLASNSGEPPPEWFIKKPKSLMGS